jgi:hypothetical protein
MMPVIFHRGGYRLPYAQFLLSLETNGVSLSDHYWFTPNNDTSFIYEGKLVNFKKKKWCEINQWENDMWSDDLNQFLFNDVLLSDSSAPLPAINNPIFVTCGNEEKIWHKEESKWYLEKRLTSKQLEREIACFKFFEKYEFLAPKYAIHHHSVSNRYQFSSCTICSGFETIKKECLTSNLKQLVPLSWYIDENCNNSVHSTFQKVKKAFVVDEKTLDKFESAIAEYMEIYGYKQLACSNFGFLVDINNNAIPAVWSNVGYVEKNPFIAMMFENQHRQS